MWSFESVLLWNSPFERGPLWKCSVTNRSVMNVICCDLECYEHGLLWTGLLWTWSFMNGPVFNASVTSPRAVCYEQLRFEKEPCKARSHECSTTALLIGVMGHCQFNQLHKSVNAMVSFNYLFNGRVFTKWFFVLLETKIFHFWE